MRIMILAIAVLLVVSACAESHTGNVIKDDEIKVCSILPLSGEYTVFGVDLARGYQLAIEEINGRGGINGRPLRLILEDDGYIPSRTVSGAMKLMTVDDCPVIITPLAESTKPVLPLAAEYGVPLLMTIDNPPWVSDEPMAYSIGYSIEAAADKIAAFSRDDGVASAVVVFDLVEFTQLSGESFSAAFTARGGSVLRTFVLNGDDDTRTLATQITQLDPDVVYFAMALTDQPSFVARMREQGFEGMLLAANSYLDDFIHAATPASDNSCKTDIPPMLHGKEAELEKRYAERYGQEPVAIKYVMLSYDAIFALANAMEKDPDYGKTLDAISGVRSSFGETFDMAGGGSSYRVESIYCVEDGEITLIER